MDTALDRAAGRASDGQTALMAAERIGDERLIEHWRRELAVADEALESVVQDEASAAAAKALANATERRG